LGFGLGPLLATWFVAQFTLTGLPYTMVLGLVFMVFLIVLIPRPDGEGLGNVGFLKALKEAMGEVWRSIFLIWFLVVLRSFVSQSFTTFIPMAVSAEGHSLVSIGFIISLYTVAGAISGLVAGYISDRKGFKPVFVVSYALATPCLLLFLYLPGPWIFVGSFGAGFMHLATLPLAVAMAQELAPRGRTIVSSMMMGFAFGFGGMLTPITGGLAEILGPQ
jgi:FSR family fosmidomycin resistance protein-like MFS transporter